MRNPVLRFFYTFALFAAALPVISCQKVQPPQKGTIGLSAEYVGQSARGLEFRLTILQGVPGTYTVTASVPDGPSVFSSQLSVEASSTKLDIAVPTDAFSGQETLTCVLENETMKGETTLHDARKNGGEPRIFFREGEDLTLEMGRPHIIAPVFYPSALRVAGNSPQWYLTTACAALQVSSDGLSAKIGGLKEGSVEVGLFLEGGKKGLSTKVILPVDPEFTASMTRTDNFKGQTVSISLKKEKAADPAADYRVTLTVDGKAMEGIDTVPAERYDIATEALKEGSHMAILQVSKNGEAEYEFLLPFTIHPTPDPSFSAGGAEATHSLLVLPHGRKSNIVMTSPGLVPDTYSLDFSESSELVLPDTTDGRTVTAVKRGQGTFRLTVHKGDGAWTSEPIPVLCYGVIDVTPSLLYDGFKASAVRGGFKVSNHPYGDGTTMTSLTVENHYTVHYGGGKVITLDGTKKSFTSVSMESSHENLWSLADDAQAMLDALGQVGATQASLEDLLIEQTLTFSFSDSTLTATCQDYENVGIHTKIKTKMICTSLDSRIPL